jgi:molecular chaperone Hsp33
MSRDLDSEDGAEQTVVACRFIAARNALLVSGDFGCVFMDCYLHLGSAGVVLRDGTDEILKGALAALALYAATRPQNETFAWTLHFEREELNVFVAVENPTGQLVGRVFSGNVRHVGGNVLHAEIAGAGGVRRRSSVDFSGNDTLRVAERFYTQSEQRPGKFYWLGGDLFAALVAQPDCDTAWLEGVTQADIAALVADQSAPPLESRRYAFCCGCTPEKIALAIGGALSGRLGEIFGPDSHINVDCPRCGVRHELPRELFA